MSTPTANLTLSVDADDSWTLQFLDSNGAAVPYSAADALEANVSTGPGAPVLFSPTIAWANALTGSAIISIMRAQSATLSPGRYELTAYVKPNGTGLRILGLVASLALSRVEDLSPGSPGVSSPTSVSQGNAPPRLATVYCTDEDIAIQAPADYANLCPKEQIIASGKDGAFLTGSAWVLTSGTVNFANRGVGANNIVYLSGPKGNFGAAGTGTLFAIDSVNAGSATLRRIGFLLGEGEPPVASALAGVDFKVLTFRPQIDNVCYAINKRFGIDNNIRNQAASLLYDKAELLDYTVASVLLWAYTNASKDRQTDFEQKLKLLSAVQQANFAAIVLHWGSLGQGKAPQSVVSFGRARR